MHKYFVSNDNLIRERIIFMSNKKILIDGMFKDETRVAVVYDGVIQDYDREDIYFKQQKGNIYLAQVTRVEHSLQAAFVQYGGDKHGFLPFSDIHPDYLSIPEDKKKDLTTLNFINPNINPNSQPTKDSKIKEGQYIIVQVVKEERGEKGVSLTSYITIAGKYCVLLCNSNTGGGISKKVVNPKQRQDLRDKLQNLNVPSGMSVILRTAVKEGEDDSIEKDYKYLSKLWDFIVAVACSLKEPSFIHSEEDVIKRTIRDITNNTFDEIVVEGQDAYNSVKQSLEMIYGENHIPLTLHKGKPIFSEYKIDEQISELYNNKIILQSGASIVMDITEALVAIDINSGKSIKGENIEETALKTNIEAAKEIGRQIKLRDLAGIIVIDFIDMDIDKNRRAVENAMWQATRNDRARVQIAKISQFGLLEMSRQRLNASHRERINEVCPCCNGVGYIKSKDLVALNIIRDIKHNILNEQIKVITVTTNKEMLDYLINYRRREITQLEVGYGVFVFLEVENGIIDNNYNIRKRKHLTEDEEKRLKNKQDIEIDVIESLAEYRENKQKQKQQIKQQRLKQFKNHKKQYINKNNEVQKTKSGFLNKVKYFFKKK
jgi:ribonuclease E